MVLMGHIEAPQGRLLTLHNHCVAVLAFKLVALVFVILLILFLVGVLGIA